MNLSIQNPLQWKGRFFQIKRLCPCSLNPIADPDNTVIGGKGLHTPETNPKVDKDL